MLENKIKTERGTDLEFSDHFFLIDPLCDWSPNQVELKAPQIGASVTKILKSIYAASELNFNVGYTLPDRNFASEFVAEKVDRLFSTNPQLKPLLGAKNDVFQKQIGDSFVYFRGTFGEKEGISSTLDLLLHDEVDRSNQKVIETYQSRLQFSKYKGTWLFSNPSAPSIGVGSKWRESDQKHWFVTCEECGHESFMDWFAGKTKNVPNHTIDKNRQLYVCGSCGKPISTEARRTGRWRAKYPAKYRDGAGWRGYWFNLMFVPWVSPAEMVDKEASSSKEHFYNFALGIAYQDASVAVDRNVIFRNYNPVVNSLGAMAMGVDSGLDKHYIVGNDEGIVEVGVVQTWEEILEIRNKYRAICVIDSGPDLTEPRRFIQALPGIFYVANYQRDQARQGNIRFGGRDKQGWVYIDRNRTIQEIMEMWVEGRIQISIKPQDIQADFVKHYENMARTRDIDALGRIIYTWDAENGEDHFVHATVYWRAAMERAGIKSRVLSPKNGIIKEKLRASKGKVIFDVTETD